MKNTNNTPDKSHSRFRNIAIAITIIIYCILAFTLPICGIINASNLLKHGFSITNNVFNLISAGLLCSAINFMVGFSLCSYPIANFVISGQFHSLSEYPPEQKRKFEKVLSIALVLLMCIMTIVGTIAIYALINIANNPISAGILFITLQGIGLFTFILGALSQIFFD